MDENLTPTLCLDGAAVRRIREEKKLTQLYVAKVVGVTTDTISRWENNRYPSVKRENVLRLAEALEVPVGQILQGQEEEAPLPAEGEFAPPARPTHRRAWIAAGISLAFILLFSAWWYLRPQETPVVDLAAERLLPSYAAPGTVVPVRVRLQVSGDAMRGFILREHFPPGWKLIEASPPASSLDNEEGTARWIVKPEEARQTISYLVRVAPGAALGTDGTFRGEIVASSNGRHAPATVGGASSVRVSPHLWADLNGDNVVDDGEMLQASETFDEMKGVHLDWKLLETIWDAGEYRWQSDQLRFAPSKSPHPPGAPGSSSEAPSR